MFNYTTSLHRVNCSIVSVTALDGRTLIRGVVINCWLDIELAP